MRGPLTALLVGLLFGAGLALSEMINPARVLGFLDLAGDWDPTLAFVMASALVPSALGYLAVRKMRRPLLAERFCIPENRVVERQLLAGAALFGVGWGLVGLCPGPAVAGLIFGKWQVATFVGAMLAGMLLHRIVAAQPRRSSPIALELEG
jgi:uncharacterized membrane protein YedE/YeeE